MAYKSIFGGNSSVPTPSGLNPSGTGYRSVFQDAKADVSVPLNAGIETTYYKSVFDKPKTVEAQTVSEVTQKFLDSFVYSKGLKMDTPALPQQIARTDTQTSPAPTTEAGYLLSSPGLKTEYFTPETAQNLKNLTSLTDPKKPVNLWDQMKDGLKGLIPGTAVTLPKMLGDGLTFIGAAKTTAKEYIDKVESSPVGEAAWAIAQGTKTGRFLDSFSGNFNERLADNLGWDMNDDGTKKALDIINPGKIYTEVGTRLKEDADARMKAHAEWARPDYFHPDNTLDGVIANLQDQPVAYLTRAFSENAPQLGVQVLLALTTGGVGSMIFMGSSAAGNTYQESIDAGKSEEEALIVGTVRGSIEAALEGTGLDNLLAKGASRKIGESFAKHLIKKVGEVTWKATVEGLTEFTQQVVANTIALTYDENRGLLDGAWASGLAGFISGAPTAGVSAILQGSGIDTNVDADTNVSNQNIIPQINGGSSQPEQQATPPGSSTAGVNAPGVSTTLGDLESPVADAPEASIAAPVQDLISGIAEAEVNAPPTTGFGATQAQPTSRVTDLPRVQIEGANQDGQSFVLNAADLRRIQGEKFITDDGQNLIEAPTNEDALRVLDARTITDRDSNFVIKYQNTDLSAKELLEQVSPQGFDVVIDMLGRVAASQETLTNLQQLARFQDLKTKSELPTDLRDVIDRYASVRDLTLAGDMVARRLEAQGVDIPKTVAPDGISLGNVDPEQVLTRLAEIQNGAQVSPMRVKLTAEGIFLPKPEDNITAAALRQMGQDVPVSISPTDLLNQVVKQFGYDNLKEYFDVREDVKAFRRGEKSLPSFSKEKSEAGARISPTQAERIVRRYFGKDEVTVQIAKKILTPAGERAVGSYRGTIITFAENPLETTPTHEVLHAYFDMFTSPSRKEQVLREVMREYNVTDRIEAEEILADEFVEFVRGADSRNWTDIIRNFFGRVWEGIKTLANQQSAVYALYNDIIAKRRPEGVQVSDEVLSNQQMFQVEGDVTLKFFAMPEFTKRKDMLKEEAISLAKSGRAALKANEQNFIINVIEGYFPEAKRISMNDLKKALLTEALPLREMETNEYGNYGLERAGVDDIVDEKSVILNTPYHHGWTGHWSNTYGSEQKKLYKTIPGKDGTLLVVDDWVDPTDATSPYSVHKAGTKDEVDTWLAEHQGDKEAINKGLFSHYRVWRGDGYILPFADKVADIIKKHTSANRSFMSFYGFLGSISDSHPMSNLNVNRSSFSPDETEAFLKKTIKALSDKPALEAAYERLNTAAKLFKADDGRLMNLASNWINADEQQNSMFNRAQLFTQWLEKNHPEMDKEASEYLYDRGVRTARSDGYVESIDRVLEQNNPEGLIIKRDFFQAAEILKTQYEQALASQGETPSYDSYIAEIQSDSFQEQKFKRRLGDVGGTMLELQIDDLSKQITEIEKALEDPRDVKIPNEVLASPDRSDLTLTIPETSEAVSKRRSLEFGKSHDHKDRLLILARYKGLVPQWMVDVAKATGTDRDLPFRVFVSSQPGESSFTTSRFGQNKLAPGSKIEISTYEGVKNFSKDYLRGKLSDLKSARADKDQQLVVHKASPDTAIKKQQEKAVNKFFAPFQDTWHERTIRQAIQDEARKGAKTISFPALTTIAKIEGFVSSNEDGTSEQFETIYQNGAGASFDYGGRDWTVLKAEDGIIDAALERYVEVFDQGMIEQIQEENVSSRINDLTFEFRDLEQYFPDIYTEQGAKNFLVGYEEAKKIRTNQRSKSSYISTKDLLVDIEKTLLTAVEKEKPYLERQKANMEERLAMIEKMMADDGFKPTDDIQVGEGYVKIGDYLDSTIMDTIELVSEGNIFSKAGVETELEDRARAQEESDFDFVSFAENAGWEVFKNTDDDYLVIRDVSNSEFRTFDSSDFESNELDDNASEETFAKTYKETLDGDQKGVVYFYDAKVIPYLKKLRKDNLELVEKDGSWWYETKVTPEDTGPVTMFQVDKTADQIVAENIVKSTATTKQAINQAIKGTKPEAVLKTEKQLLKASLRAQRRVARSIVKNTQQRLAEQFANKLADIRKVKTYLTEYLKMLPLSERGKMITLVRDAETIFDLAKATNRVNVKMEEVEKREVIADIRKTYNRVLESPGVDVGFKALVSGIFNEIQLQGKSNATMERLAKLREFIQTRTEKGEPVYIQSRLLRQLEILDKTPIKEIPVEQLEAMLSDMELLEDQGRLKKELRYQAYRRQVESIAESVMPELYPVDRPKDIKKTAGQEFTGEERMINAATKIKRTKMMTGRAFRTMDVFFDMFSGGKGLYNTQFFTQFKGRIDASFQNYLKAKDNIIDPINKMVQALDLNEEQLERVGVYAQLKQEGGLDKLIQLGFKQRDLESIKLDAEEMKLYTQMREDFETMYPKMKEYMAHVYNQDIGSVENYFPMVTNWDEMSEIEMAERFGVTQVDSDSLNPMKSGRPKKNVIAGSTIERKRGAQQKIVTNALVAYKRHMDNAIYMLEVGETIRTLSDVTKVEGFKESIGDFGYETIVNYLDLMARKGGKANDSKLAWLDTLRKNASFGVMGAKLSSILVQPSAFANGAADIGTEYAMKGASHLALDEYWRTFAYKNMPELKARVGNDPAFAEIDEDGRFEKFRTLSMKPLQFLDSITAAAIAMGAYEKYMDEHGMEVDFENPNKDALAYAQLKLRKTQGSTFFKDQPPMYSRGDLSGNRSIDRALGAFQSFMLNNWNWLSYDFPERIKRDPKQAVEAASWLLMAQIYTVTAQALSKDILAAIFGGEGEDDPFLERLMASFFSNIPIISQIMSTIEYGSVPVPLISTGQRIGDGIKGVFSKTTKPATKAKAAVRAASGVGTLMGIPGSTQAGDIVTRLMTGDK